MSNQVKHQSKDLPNLKLIIALLASYAVVFILILTLSSFYWYYTNDLDSGLRNIYTHLWLSIGFVLLIPTIMQIVIFFKYKHLLSLLISTIALLIMSICLLTIGLYVEINHIIPNHLNWKDVKVKFLWSLLYCFIYGGYAFLPQLAWFGLAIAPAISLLMTHVHPNKKIR